MISPGKSWRLSLVLLLGIWFGLASPGNLFAFSTYYQPIYERDTVSLRVSLHRLIRDQKKLGYSSLWTYYKQTDRRPDGRVRDIYSNCNFDYFRSDQGGPPGTVCGYLSREHTWPKSTWGGTKNTAYSDLINVVPGDAHTNGQKGTNPPGEVGPSSRQVGSMKFGRARPGLGYSGEVFEPADRYKGDFARIYFYFVVRYLTGEDRLNCSNWPPVREDGTGLKPWAQEILLRWHRQDPVDSVERRRNDAVFRIQRNRNPFVDHPEWVEEIWDNESRADISSGLLGVDSNYWLRMQREGASWRLQDQPVHPFQQLAWQGVDHIRIRLWTGDTGPSGLRYATKTAEQAQKYGLKPYLVIFLSEGWADYVKQPVPSRWQGLSMDEQAQEVKKYTERVAEHFRSRGIEIDFYEIGNEIDFGVPGAYEKRWSHRFQMDWMKQEIWPDAAKIIGAAQKGVRKADPQAKFMLHLTQWWNPSFATEFYLTMMEHGVVVDYLGLSYFPSSNLEEDNRISDLLDSVEQLTSEVDRPLMISEFAYPDTAVIQGQFAEWNQPVSGYSLSPKGQARWIRDFIERIEEDPNIQRAYYWSPEWYTQSIWSPFSLFDREGQAKPAFSALSRTK